MEKKLPRTPSFYLQARLIYDKDLQNKRRNYSKQQQKLRNSKQHNSICESTIFFFILL